MKTRTNNESQAIRLTNEQLEQRLGWVESMMATAHPKDLPALNATYQRIMDELVRRDLEKEQCQKHPAPSRRIRS